MMQVKDLGEFRLIERITRLITSRRRENIDALGYQLKVDVGDDSAAWHCGRGTELATTDTVVEGVHFNRLTTPWYDLGWKVIAANVSDIAAMGGSPLYALVTLGLSGETEVEDVDQLYEGMLGLADEYDLSIVGGDVVRSTQVFVTVSLTGATERSPLLRSRARPGDLVAVTGWLGSSAGGLEIMLKEMKVDPEAGEGLREAHRRPKPCIQQGRILSEQGVEAAIDVSDGLVDDLSKLCHASGVAAQLQSTRVPVDTLLKRAFPQCHLDLALNGGEDYALLFTASLELMERVLTILPPPARVVGEILNGTPGEVRVLDPSDRVLPIPRLGWDHFR